MIICRFALCAVVALGPVSAALAQDHSAHAGHGQQSPRTLGGSFVLTALNGTPLPARNPDGSGTRFIGGTLDLRLARPDSGHIALRFQPNVSTTEEMRFGIEGRVQVTGDSIRFWPDGRASRASSLIRFAWTAERELDLMPAPGVVWRFTRAADADTAFAGVQSRGTAVMGVDQTTSTHLFESLPDGGRIALLTDAVDANGEETIRAHMRDIAGRFAKGDFTLPGMVHAMPIVPGTAEMTERRAGIRYVVELLPRGAQVRIITRDAAAIRAVHEFLAFQRMDHRAMAPDPR